MICLEVGDPCGATKEEPQAFTCGSSLPYPTLLFGSAIEG